MRTCCRCFSYSWSTVEKQYQTLSYSQSQPCASPQFKLDRTFSPDNIDLLRLASLGLFVSEVLGDERHNHWLVPLLEN